MIWCGETIGMGDLDGLLGESVAIGCYVEKPRGLSERVVYEGSLSRRPDGTYIQGIVGESPDIFLSDILFLEPCEDTKPVKIMEVCYG